MQNRSKEKTVCLILAVLLCFFSIVSCSLSDYTPDQALRGLKVTYNTENTKGDDGVFVQFLPLPGDDEQYLKQNIVSRENYVFVGWTEIPEGGGTTYIFGESVLFKEDKVLYPVWREIAYNINYELKGGSFSESDTREDGEQVKYSQSVILPEVEKNESVFAGWYLTEDYSTDKKINTEVVSALSSTDNDTIKLYARWIDKTSPETRVITFHSNNGLSETKKQYITTSVSEFLDKNEFTKTGYKFAGWSENQNESYESDSLIKDMGVVRYDDNKDLYAVWAPIRYTINFDGNGSSEFPIIAGSVASMTNVAYNSEESLVANEFDRDVFYDFAYWSLTPDGSMRVTEAGFLTDVDNGVVTLYAVWVPSKLAFVSIYKGFETEEDRTLEYGSEVDFTGVEVELTYNNQRSKVISYTETLFSHSFSSTDAGKGRVLFVNYRFDNSVGCSVDDFTIEQKEVSLVWGNETYTYNGQIQGPLSVTAEQLVGNDNCEVEVTGAGKEAGIHIAEAVSLNNSNYKLPSDTTKEYFIVQKEVRLEWGKDSFTYNGLEQCPEVKVSNLVEGDSCDVEIAGKEKEVGKYTAQAVDLSNKNYKLPVNNTKVYEIHPDSGLVFVTVPVMKELTYNAEDQVLLTEGTVVNISGDTVGHIEYKLNTEAEDAYRAVVPVRKNAGEYKVNWKVVIDKPDYEFDANSEKCGTINVTIEQLLLNVSWGADTLTYNGQEQAPSVSFSGLIENDSCNAVLTSKGKDAGSYNTKIQNLTNPNYKIVGNKEKDFTIEPKTVTLNWGNLTSFTYDKTEKVPTLSLSGIEGNDECEVVVAGKASLAGKNYEAVAASLTGKDSKNYKLPVTGIKKEFNIEKRLLTLSWTVGQYTYNGQEQGPNATISGVLTSDDCKVIVSGKQKKAGTNYTASASLSGSDSANYILPSDNTKKYDIEKKPLTLSWTVGQYTYNGQEQGPNATISGVLTSDDCKVIVSGKQKNAGTDCTATAVLSGSDSANYILPSDNTRKYDIEKKPLTLSWTVGQYIYNGQEQGPDATISGVLTSDDCKVVVSGKEKKAGTNYTVSASLSGSDSANYLLPSENTKKFDIEKKLLTLNWTTEDETYTYKSSSEQPSQYEEITVYRYKYNGTLQGPDATISGVVTPDDCELTFSGYQENAGRYYVMTAKLTGSDSANYKLTSENNTALFDIERIQYPTVGEDIKITATTYGIMTITGLDPNKPYDIKISKFRFYISNLTGKFTMNNAATYHTSGNSEFSVDLRQLYIERREQLDQTDALVRDAKLSDPDYLVSAEVEFFYTPDQNHFLSNNSLVVEAEIIDE